MLTSVRIQGFKCLRDVSTQLGPFNVLIGDNDSGKTSFLQALAWLSIRRYQDLFTASPMKSVSIEVETNGGSFVLATGINGTEAVSRVVSAGARLGGVDFGAGVGYLDGPAGVPVPRIAEPALFDPVAIASAAPLHSGGLQSLVANRGQGTAAHFAHVALGDRELHDTIQRELSDATSGRVSGFIVSEPSHGEYQMSFRLYDGQVIPASALSQGLLVYVAFLALVHRRDAPDVILVEEPERSVHPLRLQDIVTLLRRLNAQRKQVVISTHSPDLLSACDPKEVRVFLRPEKDSGTEIHSLPASLDKARMRETLGDIWASRGERGLLDMLPQVKPRIRAEPAASRK